MDFLVARQPIFDRKNNVFAYELLFRDVVHRTSAHVDGDQATASVLNHSLFTLGLDQLTSGKLAFINFTENFLLEMAGTLPKSAIGIEILENVQPSPEVLVRCHELRKRGYLLILDDFVLSPETLPLLDAVSMVKVDFMNTSPEVRAQIEAEAHKRKLELIAEKVETQQDYVEAFERRYHFFQGYFFTKPDIVSGRDTPANQLAHIRILQEINRPNLQRRFVEEILRADASLTYKLLKYVNSPYFGLKTKIKSLRHALIMLSLEEVRKWLSLMVLGGLARSKTPELVQMAIVRANLCEMLAPVFRLDRRASELFLMGLLSLMDVMLDRPMPQILNDLALHDDIRSALLGQKSPFTTIYDIARAYERGDWQAIFAKAQHLDLKISDLADCFVKTIEQSNHILEL